MADRPEARAGRRPPPDAANLRSRKRFARRQWRRRWLAWRPVLALVVVLALLATGVYAVWFSSWLDVERVDVSGAVTVDPDEVRRRAGIDDGTPLASVDLAAAERAIRSMDVVRDARVQRQWPDTVLVEIEERVAIAVVEIGDRLRGLDADGKVFGGYRRVPPDLPRVVTKIGTSAAALAEAAQVISALPETLTRNVRYLEVTTVDEILLVLKDGRRVVWGSSADSERKADVLEGLLQTEAEVYDVSVPTQPTTR